MFAYILLWQIANKLFTLELLISAQFPWLLETQVIVSVHSHSTDAGRSIGSKGTSDPLENRK